MPFEWSPLTRKLLPSIEEFNIARFNAEAATNADPRMMLAAISRVPQANSRLQGIMQSIRDSILGWDWDVRPPKGLEKNEQAIAVARRTRERIMKSGIHHHFDVIVDAKFFGLTGLTQTWNQSDGGKWIARCEPIASTDIVWQRYEDGRYDGALIADTPRFSTTPIEGSARDGYVFAYYNPVKSTRPNFLGGLMRIALPLVILKQGNWKSWAIFSKKFIDPWRHGTYETGTDDKEIEAAKNALEQLGENSWAVIPKSIELKFLEALKSGSVEAYKELMKSVDDELEILVKGEAETTQLNDRGGSRAAVQTMKLVRDDGMWRTMADVQRVVNEQHIAVDYRLNESATDASMRPVFGFEIDEPKDFEANARVVTELAAAGYDLLDEEVSARTGLTVKKRTASPPPITP